MENILLIGQADQKQIDSWKAANPNGIFGVTVGGHIGYFKKPGRNDLNCAMSKFSNESPLDMYEELANLTFLGGSDEVLKNDNKFMGVVTQLKTITEGEKAELVNL